MHEIGIIVSCCVMLVTLCTLGSGAEPQVIGNEKQLFIDDALIGRSSHVTFQVHSPDTTEQVCIVADKPWELGGEVHPFGVSMFEDDGIYRMYYPCYDSDYKLLFCTATSTDGIHWDKPELDIVPYKGIEKTNIIYANETCPKSLPLFFGTCVFKDENPACPPDQKYKMINGDADTWLFVSPDGLHFRPLYDKPSFRMTDTNNVLFWDESRGKYLAFVRNWILQNANTDCAVRVIGRSEISDLANWPPDDVVVRWDEQDQESFDKDKFVAMDLYNSSAIKYPYAPNAYFMFPTAFYHFPDPPKGIRTNDGLADVQFAASRDSIHWNRYDRKAFMPLEGDILGLYMATGTVRRGDLLYLYYGIYYRTHGDPTLDERDSINLATIRLDGFVSLDAPAEGGRFTTKPVIFEGSQLTLNVVGDDIKVGILDEQGRPYDGFGLDDCDSLSGDHIAGVMKWRGKSDVSSLAGKPVKLDVKLQNASLYALQFE